MTIIDKCRYKASIKILALFQPNKLTYFNSKGDKNNLIKKRWKWITGIVALTFILTVSVVSWFVFTFINDTFQSTPRISSYNNSGSSTATPNLQVTATVRSHYNAVIVPSNPQSSITTGTMTLFNTTTVVTVPPSTTGSTITSPDLSTLLVQHIRSGQRVTLMYLGYGGSGHDGAYLTDTILVLSLDPQTKTVSEFNVPRDLYVPFPIGPNGRASWGKINGVFSTIMEWAGPNQKNIDAKYHWTDNKSQLESAANLTADTVEQILGVPIDAWVTMDFNGFRKLIDAVGGVKVCVDRSFTDNKYPRNDDSQIDAGVMTVHFDAGCQRMDGETAIRFARSRHSEDLMEGGDFARSRRQMKVIDALHQKVQTGKLFFQFLNIMQALDKNIHTSLTLAQAKAFLAYIQSEEGKQLQRGLKFDPEILGPNLVTDSNDPKLGYILEPHAGSGNFKNIQQWVQSDFAHLALRREQVWLQVLNCSGRAGAGSKLSTYLFDEGFHIAESSDGTLLKNSILYDYTNGTAVNNIAELKKMLPELQIINRTAERKPYVNAPDLMLYIGENYRGVIAAS